jgi:integrase/recombinase XerD
MNMELIKYLQTKLREKTVEVYSRDISNYLKAVGVQKAKRAGYKEVLDYIGALRKRYGSGTVHRILQSIKAYYQWLLDSGQRHGHPCKDLRLLDNKARPVQLQDLFKQEELEQLTSRKERYKLATVKNQIIMGLLVYQGLMSQEITGLKLKDLNLEEGTIYIKGSGHVNSRTLKLKGKQVILLQRYLREVRAMQKERGTDILLLNIRGTALQEQTVNYLVSSYRHLFPERLLNPTTIRQSVIANFLKSGKDIRLVQTFAGHRNPSTTEKYKQTQVEELKAAVMKFHPLK